jgi:hypothetical protein
MPSIPLERINRLQTGIAKSGYGVQHKFIKQALARIPQDLNCGATSYPIK